MKLTHHAYLFEGSQTMLSPLTLDASCRLGISHKSSDLWVRSFDVFGIVDARDLTRRAMMQGSGVHQLFIVAAVSITVEAQQAMLKLLEEPQSGTVFILLVSHGSVLPTVRSRCLSYPYDIGRINNPQSEEYLLLANTFITSTSKERSTMITTLLKDEERTRDRVRMFLDALEKELHARLAEPRVREALHEISFVRGYLDDRSASYKMLLEHLAVVV